MDSSDADQREPHITDPPEFVSIDDLGKNLGILYFKIDADNYLEDALLQKVRTERHYTYEDEVDIRPGKLPEYEKKLKMFFEEHLHADEEIRLVLEGSGYFDARDHDDRWLRVEVVKGDMIILPAGMYHRFTLDQKNYIKAKRYFVGEPVWTPHNRGEESDAHSARSNYLRDHGKACKA